MLIFSLSLPEYIFDIPEISRETKGSAAERRDCRSKGDGNGLYYTHIKPKILFPHFCNTDERVLQRIANSAGECGFTILSETVKFDYRSGSDRASFIFTMGDITFYPRIFFETKLTIYFSSKIRMPFYTRDVHGIYRARALYRCRCSTFKFIALTSRWRTFITTRIR